jgi:sugar diacid utilization regulator
MNAPRLTGRLRELAVVIADDPAVVVARLQDTLMASEPGYANQSPLIKQDVRDFLYFCASVWFRTLLEGKAPTEADLAVVEASVRRRVHQGISLNAVLRAVRLGTRELWATLLELSGNDAMEREQLLAVFSLHLLDYFDDLAQRIASAYLDEQFQRARWRDALRYELLNVVFSFPDDEAGFRRAAQALGVDPAAPHACLAFDISLPDALSPHLESELDRLLLQASRCTGIPADSLVRALYRDRLVIWTPVMRGESVLVVDNAVSRQAARLVDALPGVRRAGVGLANTGARGWAGSLDEAFSALASGERLGSERTVLSFSDIVLNESVLRSPNALRYLDALIERLSHEPELLSTLRVFLEGGQHRKRASERLGIHPNTLNYRLARIETMLGASLADAGWLARLHVALTLRQASDPASRPPGKRA